MRLHRFYIEPQTVELKHDFWLHDERLINQWGKVLRFPAGQEVVLFDGQGAERLYKIVELTPREAHVQLVTDFVPKTPVLELYLFWSLLKKDKNDWVLQKCTELGVSHFVPLLAERSEKTGFNEDRARKIVIEAAEQCGRNDIPTVRQPIDLPTVFDEFQDKLTPFVCEQTDEPSDEQKMTSDETTPPVTHDLSLVTRHPSLTQNPFGVLIGPEGGWSDTEKQFFTDKNVSHLNLHDFTLRAETACVAAVTKLLQ